VPDAPWPGDALVAHTERAIGRAAGGAGTSSQPMPTAGGTKTLLAFMSVPPVLDVTADAFFGRTSASAAQPQTRPCRDSSLLSTREAAQHACTDEAPTRHTARNAYPVAGKTDAKDSDRIASPATLVNTASPLGAACHK
jgi:hypothetical protein